MNKIIIMQGDSYDFPFRITDEDGKVLTGTMITEIELVLGPYTKTLSGGEIRFNAQKEVFLTRLTQEETFKLIGDIIPQIRVKANETDDVIGRKLEPIHVQKSSSKRII